MIGSAIKTKLVQHGKVAALICVKCAQVTQQITMDDGNDLGNDEVSSHFFFTVNKKEEKVL